MKPGGENEKRSFLYLPEYWEAEHGYSRKAMKWLMKQKDPVFAQIKEVSYSETLPISQNTLPNGQVLRTGSVQSEHAITLKFEDIQAGNFDALVSEIDLAADAVLKDVMPHLFGVVGQTSDAVGNSLHAHGQPYSFDLHLEMLKKIEISFDADGNPRMPTLVVSPQQADHIRSLPSTNADQQRALDAIIDEKRRAFFASRRYRTLPRRFNREGV